MGDAEVATGSETLRISFLVSDSRSGSTYLARMMHERFKGVVVTPEISLREAMRAHKRNPDDIEAIGQALDNGRFFSALGVDRTKAMNTYQPGDAKNFGLFVFQMFREAYSNEKPEHIIVKKGHHVFDAARIKRFFPSAQFICLYRDPRAIFESKRRTKRPYWPKENMAWAGIVGSVLRGKKYFGHMIKIEESQKSIRLKFEDLVESDSTVLVRLTEFLSAEILGDQEVLKKNYIIPSREEAIHPGAKSPSINQQSVDAWKIELTHVEQSIVDLLTKSERKVLGYPDSPNFSSATGVLGVIKDIPVLFYRLFSHVTKRSRSS